MVRRTLFASVLLLCFSYAQGIEELLQKYKEASELYRRTRKESLGHVIIFTREDLERMQAYRLSDVLRSLRFFTVGNNRFGVLTLHGYGSQTSIPRYIRLYINDHEVSSLHTGSPFLVWENFPLDVVEHIEIYQSTGAIELGNEPAMLIVKIYTKEPKKENVRYLRTLGTSRKGYEIILYSAEEVNCDFSYIFLLTDGSDNRHDRVFNGRELSRDSFYNYAFLGLYFKRTKLELGYGSIRKEPFMGFSLNGVTAEGYTRAEDLYLSLTVYPLKDRSLKVAFSLDRHRRRHYERSDTGLLIPVFMSTDPLRNPKDFYENAFFNKFDLYVSKELSSEKNKLLSAFSYKLYNSDIDSRYYTRINGERVDVSAVQFNRQEIYSLILEDQVSITPRNLLIGGIKLDKYFRNGGFKNFNEFIARLGYISAVSDNLILKGFVARSYIPPYFYDVEISGRDLDTIKIPVSLTLEGVATLRNLNLNFGGGYVKIDDVIVPDKSGKLINSPDILELKPLFAQLDYRYERQRITVGYSLLLDPEKELSPTSGGFVRILSSLRKIDIFTELIYRSGFNYGSKRISESYDLNAGMTYWLTDDIAVRLKGENLLDRATELPYLIPQSGDVVTYPVRRRTLYLGVSWVF